MHEGYLPFVAMHAVKQSGRRMNQILAITCIFHDNQRSDSDRRGCEK